MRIPILYQICLYVDGSFAHHWLILKWAGKTDVLTFWKGHILAYVGAELSKAKSPECEGYSWTDHPCKFSLFSVQLWSQWQETPHATITLVEYLMWSWGSRTAYWGPCLRLRKNATLYTKQKSMWFSGQNHSFTSDVYLVQSHTILQIRMSECKSRDTSPLPSRVVFHMHQSSSTDGVAPSTGGIFAKRENQCSNVLSC